MGRSDGGKQVEGQGKRQIAGDCLACQTAQAIGRHGAEGQHVSRAPKKEHEETEHLKACEDAMESRRRTKVGLMSNMVNDGGGWE